MAWRLLRALIFCKSWIYFSTDSVGPEEGSPRCEPRTHFGCELAARFGPNSVYYTWLPKRMPVRAEQSQVRTSLLFALFTNLQSGEGYEGCRIPCLRSAGSDYFSLLGLLTHQYEVPRKAISETVLYQSRCRDGLTTRRRIPDITKQRGPPLHLVQGVVPTELCYTNS